MEWEGKKVDKYRKGRDQRAKKKGRGDDEGDGEATEA